MIDRTRLVIAALTLLVIALGWKLHAQRERLLDLEDYFEKTTVKEDSPLARRVEQLNLIDDGGTLEDSRRLLRKQLFFLHNRPCVSFIVARRVLGVGTTYCFGDMQGKSLLFKEVPRPPQ